MKYSKAGDRRKFLFIRNLLSQTSWSDIMQIGNCLQAIYHQAIAFLGERKGFDMFSKSFSAAIDGIEAFIVNVEADVSDGLPSFDLVGFLGSEVKEAKERVKTAIRNSAYSLPPKRITINLSPADVKKEGTAFDLAIAVAILTASGYIPNDYLEQTLFIGELSLDGKIQRVNGILPFICAAQKQGFKRCIVPKDNAREAAVVGDLEIIGIDSLSQTMEYLSGLLIMNPEFVDVAALFLRQKERNTMDFSDIIGQIAAKRAIEVSVAGQHNIMLIGTPGSGKTMLAKRIPSIMPELCFEESLEISKIYSVSGQLDSNRVLILERPYRSPHHTITQTALIGGGRCPRPGEISLAAHGVLFLDELTEFDNRTLEVLRQPLEEKVVTISRLHATYTYPANFMLVAALNPCKCGYYPDRSKCNCSMRQIKQYIGKISRPLLDRIDICVETMPIAYKELTYGKGKESSSVIRERIKAARKRQLDRYQKSGKYFNSQLSPSEVKKYCSLGDKEQKILEQAFTSMNLSARAYHRILKVARTIADLEGKEMIEKHHLIEAIGYRGLDRKYWGEV